jgi:glycerol-3-phosphate dehydrogenase
MFGMKSRLIYGTGLRLYDWLAGADAIAHHKMLRKQEVAQIEPELAADGLNAAAIFYDCGVASARFVVENILDAMSNGALAANYARADAWERSADGLWYVQCTDTLAGEQFELRTRKLVDARGAWSDGDSLRLVRGSHIVIPRVNASDHAIAHFEPDGRIIFLIPWGSRKQLTLSVLPMKNTGPVPSTSTSLSQSWIICWVSWASFSPGAGILRRYRPLVHCGL